MNDRPRPHAIRAILDKRYRYTLQRNLVLGGRGRLVWIMLNPSTADDELDDPTIRRCMKFGALWGYADMVVGNLFAFRATDPRQLSEAVDPVGSLNDEYLREITSGVDRIVCAWGNGGALNNRAGDVRVMLWDRELWGFGQTKQDQPRHPLYVLGDQPLELLPEDFTINEDQLRPEVRDPAPRHMRAAGPL